MENNSILFFKAKIRIKNHYNKVGLFFKYNNKIYEVNKQNLLFLKESLILPFKIETYALSRANVGRIIYLFKDDNNVKLKTIKRENDKYKRFELTFYKTKQKLKIK